MSSIRVEVTNGTYENEDAYINLISYITNHKYILNKHYFGGYGVFPLLPDIAIKQFYESKANSNFISERNIWHFFISYSTIQNPYIIMRHAHNISGIFAPNYQIFYALHEHQQKPHVHFAVNNFSYRPSVATLDVNTMKIYLNRVLHYLQENTSCNDISLQFQGKKESHT